MISDEALYRQYISGDETGLDELMKRYGNPLTLYINGYLHDVHEAEDLMIEVFSYLFTKKPRIRDGGFKAYLYKAARHMALRQKADGGFPSALMIWPKSQTGNCWWKRLSGQRSGTKSCISAWAN